MLKASATRSFDVFICHAGFHDEWANTFYENLIRSEFRVCNDRDHQLPGKLFPEKIRNAIRDSQAALVLIGGRAQEREWVRKEMDLILERQSEDEGFVILPILVEEEHPDFPIPPSLKLRDWIDFRPPMDYRGYRVAFQQVVSALKRSPHGPGAPWKGPLDMPEACRPGDGGATAATAQKVFDSFQHARIVLLLSQEGALDGRFPEMAVRRAEEMMGVGRIFSATLIHHHSYLRLGQFLGFAEPTPDLEALDRGFEKEMDKQFPNFLFLRGLERLAREPLRDLAHLLRSIVDSAHHYGDLRVILQGGRKLSELRHGDGLHSIFTNSELQLWPEMTPQDLKLLLPQGAAAIQPEQARMILSESGGRPDLAQALLTALAARAEPLTPEDCREILRHEAALLAPFGRLRRENEEFLADLREALDRDEIGLWSFATDEFRQWVYWSNLARLEGRRLVWRCDALREAGRDALESL